MKKTLFAAAIIAVSGVAVATPSFANDYSHNGYTKTKKEKRQYRENREYREEARNSGWQYKPGATTTKEFLSAHQKFTKDYRTDEQRRTEEQERIERQRRYRDYN